MGCSMSRFFKRDQNSKSKGEKTSEDKLPEPPAPAPLDPRLPFTARQKFSIVKSWKAISRSMEPTGVHMFLRLFEEHSELLTLFDKFRELKTRDEQAESLELAEHATIVMNSIDEGIKAMDNVEFFFDLLYQIGATHRKIPGFKKEYFWRIENPFLEAVKMTLDERYTENIESIYKITVKFIIETVVKGYEMAEEREVNDNITNSQTKTEELSANSIDITLNHQQCDNKAVNDVISEIKLSANMSMNNSSIGDEAKANEQNQSINS